MITTLILTKVMDYIFFIALLWVAFFVYGIIKRVSTGSPVELKTLFIITEIIILIYMITAASDAPWWLFVLWICIFISDVYGIIKYKKKKFAEK